MAKRVRIFFINCPSVATDAASFLILAQNQVQTAIQFEVIHFWIYGQSVQGPLKGIWNTILSHSHESFHSWSLPWLERRYRAKLDIQTATSFQIEIKHKEALNVARNAVSKYDDWFSKCGYPTYDTVASPAIVVTETPMWGKYISFCGSDIAIVSAAKWKDFFAPASGLEYVLTAVQRLALRLSYGTGIKSHYPTRGCLWDFHVHQPDSKISSFLGMLCETCRTALKQSASTEEFDQLSRLLENKWYGTEADSSSIAGILKKNYKYSLTRSTELHPGLLSPAIESIKTESGKNIVEIVKWIIILVITILLVTYFPDIAEKVRKLLHEG